MIPWLLLVIVMALSVVGRLRLASLPPHPDERVRRLAYAISVAEGYWNPGAIPHERNNPGDIMENGVIKSYPTPTDGWLALYRQVELMLTGKSRFYRPDMTIEEVAGFYTATEQSAWARNVALALGVQPGTKLEDV